jgi:hypothetical protein
MPPAMAWAVAAGDARDERQAVNDRYAAEDEQVMRARVAEHVGHQFEARTGYTEAEWFWARQQVQFARGDLGWDANAPLGSPQHPEPLVDGASVCRPAAGGTARRSGISSTLSGNSGVGEAEELARRVAFEAEAGREVIARARSASRRAEISRLERLAELERQAGGPVTATAGGRVAVRASVAGGRWPDGPVLSRPELASRLPRDW